MKGMFKLDEKYRLSDNCRTEAKVDETFMEIQINGNDFVLIRSQQSDGAQGSPLVKRFSLGRNCFWTRTSGKQLKSLFEFKPNSLVSSHCQLIETISDRGKITKYFYHFNLLTNSLTIEWTIGSIKKVEVFNKIN